jgi:DNA-binding PadR family transcriptional regulator
MSAMEEELVRGVIRNLSRLIILWILKNNALSGYSVLKEMQRITEQKFHPGIVYPLLYELEDEHFIMGEWSRKGTRRIKRYTITEKGIELLDRLHRLFEFPMKGILQDFLSENNP